MKNNEDRYNEIIGILKKTYIDKNSDYGNSVHKTYAEYGIISFLVRIEDKLNRIKNLTLCQPNQHIKDESINDTLLDLANYAILAVIERERDYEVKNNDKEI